MQSMRMVVAAAVAAAAGGACTIVVPPMDASPMMTPTPVPVVPPPPIPAHALFIANLHQSSANLASYYAGLSQAIVSGLGNVGIRVTRWAVAPTYPSASHPELPELLFGGTQELNPPDAGASGGGAGGGTGATGPGGIPILPLASQSSALSITTPDGGVIDIGDPGGFGRPNPGDIDLTSALQQMAATGFFDGTPATSESAGVVRLGARLSEARLPVELGGLDGQDFFDSPPSLFLVVYLQPLARHCGLSDGPCLVDGRPASDIFAETDADGRTAWLRYRSGGMPVRQVVHVAVTTKEGESMAAFRARCGAVEGFPRNLFDVMEPSPVAYYDPLITAVSAAHPGTGQSSDMCQLLGTQNQGALISLITRVAVMAGPPSPAGGSGIVAP